MFYSITHYIKENTMNKKIICFSALALSMSMSQATLACDCDMNSARGEHYEHMTSKFEHMTEKLDLTADQKEKIKTISEKARNDMKPMFEEIRANRMKLNELADAKDIDQTQIDKTIDQNKDIMGSMMKMRVMTRHDIMVVLTDKQKAKLDVMMAHWKAKHMKKD